VIAPRKKLVVLPTCLISNQDVLKDKNMAQTKEEVLAKARINSAAKRAAKIAADPEAWRAYNAAQNKKSRDKQRAADPEAFKARDAMHNKKHRKPLTPAQKVASAAVNKDYQRQRTAAKRAAFLSTFHTVEIDPETRRALRAANRRAKASAKSKTPTFKVKRQASRQTPKQKASEAAYKRSPAYLAQQAAYIAQLHIKTAGNVRASVRAALQRGDVTKAAMTTKYLGCSVAEARAHIAARFQPGMSWDNWAMDGWHLDHIRPIASFDRTVKGWEFQACHYTNLQPLWALDNLSKHAKWDPVAQ
jgi:hypothetical protein